MKDYKIVRLAALHGLNVSRHLSKVYPNFSTKPYGEQLRCLFKAKVLYSDGFSLSMREIGRDAHEIVWDFESLQKKWAEENSVGFSDDNWMSDIVIAQIKTRHLSTSLSAGIYKTNLRKKFIASTERTNHI